MSASYCEEKDNLLKRLRRIEGQVRGLQRMVEEEKYCVDVLNQITAVRAALKSAGIRILNCHIQGCVRDCLAEQDNNEEVVKELLQIINRFSE
ncbi:MAG: metal-sensitive transcriptional regulator [Halanaerobium sp.]|nr:metal-sensitive transcriptional regulator [Halanaerobium sp.]